MIPKDISGHTKNYDNSERKCTFLFKVRYILSECILEGFWVWESSLLFKSQDDVLQNLLYRRCHARDLKCSERVLLWDKH